MGLLRWLFGNREEPAATDADVLNDLITRVERLELDNADRQIKVLEAMDKAVRALAQRDRMTERRQAEAAAQGGEADGDERAPVGPPRLSSTAHLSRRFKGF